MPPLTAIMLSVWLSELPLHHHRTQWSEHWHLSRMKSSTVDSLSSHTGQWRNVTCFISGCYSVSFLIGAFYLLRKKLTCLRNQPNQTAELWPLAYTHFKLCPSICVSNFYWCLIFQRWQWLHPARKWESITILRFYYLLHITYYNPYYQWWTQAIATDAESVSQKFCLNYFLSASSK